MMEKSPVLLFAVVSAQLSLLSSGAFVQVPPLITSSAPPQLYPMFPQCRRQQFISKEPAATCLRCSIGSNRNIIRDVSLSMGIRSFITKKILRKGGEDHDNESGDKNNVTLHSILQSPDSVGFMESPNNAVGDDLRTIKSTKVEDGEMYPTSTKDQPAHDEAIKERIRRMKGGGMTEEEKAQFLNNALTQSSPKRQKPKGPPIRQKIPGLDDDNKVDTSGGRKKKSSDDSTSSAKENLWNALTKKDQKEAGKRGGSSSTGDISVASLMMDGKTKSEEAKRKYMESIMNPDRFSTFSTYQQRSTSLVKTDNIVPEDTRNDVNLPINDAASIIEESNDGESSLFPGGVDFAQMKRQIEEDRAMLKVNEKPEQTIARDAVESILAMISSNNDKKSSTASTTVAATNNVPNRSTDHLAARLGQAAEEQEKREAELRLAAEKKREEEKQRFAELQRQREEEARRKEEERIEKARKIAEEARRQQEEKAAAEKADLEARRARQDDYWAKKLETERMKRESSEPIEIKRKKEVIARDNEEKFERAVAKEVMIETIREEERAREDPHEGEILKEAAEEKLRDRERVRDIESISAARLSRTVPRPSKEDVSVSSFVREQQKKKEEIDRLRQLDLQSLKSLNSPLPSPSKSPVGISPSPFRAPPKTAARPAPSPVKKSVTDLSTSSSQTVASSKSPSSSPRSAQSNLFELTKATTAGSKSKESLPQRRVVRQQTPLSSVGDDDNNDYDDDDYDDDENLMRSGAPGLTVADALMKQRKKGGVGSIGGKQELSAEDKAKQWGIDMSRFN